MKKPASTTKRNLSVSLENNLEKCGMVLWIFESNASLSKVCGKSASSEDAVFNALFLRYISRLFSFKRKSKMLRTSIPSSV